MINKITQKVKNPFYNEGIDDESKKWINLIEIKEGSTPVFKGIAEQYQIKSTDINPGFITAAMITPSAITTEKLNDGAVTENKLGVSATVSPNIKNYNIFVTPTPTGSQTNYALSIGYSTIKSLPVTFTNISTSQS